MFLPASTVLFIIIKPGEISLIEYQNVTYYFSAVSFREVTLVKPEDFADYELSKV